MGRLDKREWLVRDRIRNDCALRVARVTQQTGTPKESERRTVDRAIHGLGFEAFDHRGPAGDGWVTRALLEVYDGLTGERLSERAPNLRDDRQGVLQGLDREIRWELERAPRDGRLGVKKPRARFFFVVPDAPRRATAMSQTAQATRLDATITDHHNTRSGHGVD